MNSTSKLALAAVFALSVASPTHAQQASQAAEGDYYAPRKTIVQQPTAQELHQAREGDYYVPGKTVVQQPTAHELNQAKKGDHYAPNNGQ